MTPSDIAINAGLAAFLASATVGGSYKKDVRAAVEAAYAVDVEELEAENAVLREALKPFADAAEWEVASFSGYFLRAARAAMGDNK